MGGLV